MICRILKQLPLQQREFANKRTGAMETFSTIGFVLASGADTFFAELTGDKALRLNSQQQQQFDTNYYYRVSLSAHAEEWNTQDGEVRHGTRLYINSIAVL